MATFFALSAVPSESISDFPNASGRMHSHDSIRYHSYTAEHFYSYAGVM